MGGVGLDLVSIYLVQRSDIINSSFWNGFIIISPMIGENSMLEQLKNLRRDTTHGWDDRTKGGAPHKPFLILSILDGMDQGWIASNKIFPNQDIVDGFFSYWDAIMGEDKSTTVALPYFHMGNESFWSLKYKPGKKEFSYSPSWGSVKDRIEYAVIDPVLFEYLMTADGRMEARSFLTEQYFGDVTSSVLTKIREQKHEVYGISEELKLLAAEPFVINHSDRVEEKHRESKSQQRDQAFSKNIRESYNYTCALCRDKVITPSGKVLVQGAHILSWSETLNDDPRNGISMCPNHHWMFDSYMLTIRPDYSVKVSKWVEKMDNRVKDIQDLKNEPIALPHDEVLYPAEPALSDHNQRFEEFHKRWK